MHDLCSQVHVCVNMCVAFADPISSALEGMPRFANSHRSRCPVCREPRYLDGTSPPKPRRVVYYFPMRFWFQELFTRPDLVPLLDVNIPASSFPSGSVRRSDGWQRKVVRNQKMASDSRNQAISGACDGVPFFKDRHAAGGWVFVLHPENAPPGVARSMEFSHMVALAPSTYQSSTEDGRIVTRKKFVFLHDLVQYTLYAMYICLLMNELLQDCYSCDGSMHAFCNMCVS